MIVIDVLISRLETSTAPSAMPIKRSYDIESSQFEPMAFSPRFFNWNNLETVVTVTAFSTSFSLQTTTVKKSFTLASSLPPGPGLLCLPVGYTVC